LSNKDVDAQTSSAVKTVEIAQVENSAYPDVSLYVRVLDGMGQRITDIDQTRFNVTEDEVSVQITNYSPYNTSPIVSFLVVDVSSSMSQEGKIEGAKQAALKFIQMMRPQDQVGLITFNELVHVIVPLTSNKDVLSQAVGELSSDGNTAWHDGAVKAAELLKSVPGRKSIVILTDGLDNQSKNSLADAAAKVQQIETPVYTIGLGTAPTGFLNNGGYNKSELTFLADQTGGKFYATPTANQLSEIFQVISQSTQGEYVLTYHSPRPDYDGTRRNIVVCVDGVCSSKGYVEPHLLNIQSNLSLGFLLLPVLLILLLLPILIQAISRQIQAHKAVSASGGALPGTVEHVPPVPVGSNGCAYCGHPIKPTAHFCPACGKPNTPKSPLAQETPRYCTNCGQPLRPGAKFCAACGYKCV